VAKKPDKKMQCFVVSPIGATGSPERVHADWLYEGIIVPVFTNHFSNFEVTRADKIWLPGSIDSQIIELLLDAELVIADITTLNPNVFYEIGIRHAVKKPVVHLVSEGEPIPFDLKLFRHIEFSVKTPQGLVAAKEALKASVEAALAPDAKVDNPVTRTIGRYEYEKDATPEQLELLRQVDELNARLGRVETLTAPLRNTVQLNADHISRAQRRQNRGHIEIAGITEQHFLTVLDAVNTIVNEYFPDAYVLEHNGNNNVYQVGLSQDSDVNYKRMVEDLLTIGVNRVSKTF
jgi:hypothetical protein